jgi:hypothetical protein
VEKASTRAERGPHFVRGGNNRDAQDNGSVTKFHDPPRLDVRLLFKPTSDILTSGARLTAPHGQFPSAGTGECLVGYHPGYPRRKDRIYVDGAASILDDERRGAFPIPGGRF